MFAAQSDESRSCTVEEEQKKRVAQLWVQSHHKFSVLNLYPEFSFEADARLVTLDSFTYLHLVPKTLRQLVVSYLEFCVLCKRFCLLKKSHTVLGNRFDSFECCSDCYELHAINSCRKRNLYRSQQNDFLIQQFIRPLSFGTKL